MCLTLGLTTKENGEKPKTSVTLFHDENKVIILQH